jgi:hypothetical protein
LAAAGLGVAAPTGPLSYIANRCSYIQGLLANVAYPFTITASNFSTNSNYISIGGTAPIAVSSITINGVVFPVTWTSVSSWTAIVALNAGPNVLNFAGYDRTGNPVANSTGTVTVTYTGISEQAQGRVLINEIMYNPAVPNTGFVELYNTSTISAFDLSGYRLDGADFTFPGGTIIAPNGFLVVAENAAAFTALYGTSIPLAGIFNGTLKHGGETLKLVDPGATPAQDVIIDEVTYDSAPPWPAAADGFGPSLQLIDPGQDNNRVLNWAVAPSTAAQATPGATNSVRANLGPFPLVWLNEIQPNNVNGPRDNFGERDPWVELYNSGGAAVDLTGYYLSDNYSNLLKWPFPAGTSLNAGQFRVVWLDNEPGETSGTNLHANFRAGTTNGSVVLTKVSGSVTNIIDYLNYGFVNRDRSYGAFPDGSSAKRHTFYYATPGGANSNSWPVVPVLINEWMASNTRTIVDAFTGKYSDWFELYNAGPADVDLSGYYLANSVTDPTQFAVPSGYIVPSGGFLLVWADNETGQNNVSDPALHVNFKLNASGESIALFTPDGSLIDSIVFGQQTNDVSQGRWPDGNSAPYYFMPAPTPGAANILGMPTNHPPSLAVIPDQTVYQGSLLSFTAIATDVDAGQTLSYSLDPGSPPNAAINANSGVFTWIPTQANPPATYSITVRVTDNGTPSQSDVKTVRITVLAPPPLVITSVHRNPDGSLSLTWQTQPLKNYRVSFSADLGPPAWTVLTNLTATTTELSTTDAVNLGPARFYRIELLNP